MCRNSCCSSSMCKQFRVESKMRFVFESLQIFANAASHQTVSSSFVILLIWSFTSCLENGTYTEQRSSLKTKTVYCAFFQWMTRTTTHRSVVLSHNNLNTLCVFSLCRQNVDLLRKFHDYFFFKSNIKAAVRMLQNLRKWAVPLH